jgi:hypothetical protein
MSALYKILLQSLLIASTLLLAGCLKKEATAASQSSLPQTLDQKSPLLMPLHPDPAEKITPTKKKPGIKKRESSIYDADNPAELDFDVENQTGKTLFVTCFTYQRRRSFDRWHWVKSPVYEIMPHQTVTIDVDSIPDTSDRNAVFGYLAVLESHQEAQDAVIELLEDQKKLDLDQLIKLKGKKVALTVEKYGFKNDLLEFDFVEKDKKEPSDITELDFGVENKTGNPIFVTCFAYQKKAKGSWLGATEAKDDMSTWRFEKSQVIRLEPNQIGTIDVGTIVTMRDRNYVRGYLGVFSQDQEELAQKSTYELLPNGNKLNLGELNRLASKKIVIEVENYGIIQDYFDYVIKPAKTIDFKAIHGPKKS